MPLWDPAISPGPSKHGCLWGLGALWVKRKGEQMSQSPSVAGAFHPLSHPCSLVPSPCGRSWGILNRVPLNRADAQVSPGIPLSLALTACLSWLLQGCFEGVTAPIPAAPHLPAHPSTRGIVPLSPPVFPILCSISPTTSTTALWSPRPPFSNGLPFLLPSLFSCLPLQN